MIFFATSKKNPGLHIIFRSSRSPQKQETWTRQRCLWMTQYDFGACFANKPNMMMIFIRRANLAPCYVLFLSILRRRKFRRVPRRRRITSRSWCHVLSPISNSAHTPGVNIFVLLFFDFSAIQAEFILDYWNKSDDFWDSLRSFRSSQSSENVSIWSLQNLRDRLDRPDGTQLYPSDRGRPGRLPSSG